MAYETFNLAQSIAAASKAADTALSLREYSDEKTRNAAIKKARGEALDKGTPEAIKALMKLDPENAEATINALAAMDARQREQIKLRSEETAKQILWVEQGATPEEKAQRWDSVVDFMAKNGNQNAEQYRGKYSPALSQQFIMKAMTVDDINEQFSFGQLKVAEQDGKPVYIQTNEAGQTRVAPVPEGVRPTEKEFKGTAKGAGDTYKMKASDSNSIRAAAAGLFGGTWDPQTGRVLGVEKDMTKKVASISERASQLFMDSQGKMPHDQAVGKAARELGIEMQNLNPKPLRDWIEGVLDWR